MDRLPDEVIAHILSFLDVSSFVSLQQTSRRLCSLGRDNTLWKTECFNSSRAEALRRRQHLFNVQDPRLAQLRNAVTALPGDDLTAWDVSQLRGSSQPRASPDPAVEARVQRARSLANWEPGYPSERIDYYEEYIHRHAPVSISWLKIPTAQSSDKDATLEATGIGTINDSASHVNRVVAPLDDGSICIWDLSPRRMTTDSGRGNLVHRSRPGLLSGQPRDASSESHSIMTETGAVECVAIDSGARKGYFAVRDLLQEVDLTTLELISTRKYPFPITALSEARNGTPLTVGTNMTIHLHDPRDRVMGAQEAPGAGELIGGSIYTHANLVQPGPLSILHHTGPEQCDTSIWVAGRFTSLLNYDRRLFPRLRGTIHSGARIACLTSMPFPMIPRSLDLLRNPHISMSELSDARQAPGTTLLAAAEYKGKGSLELYGLPTVESYQNRQTTSASKLLSVAAHGGRIVFSDGDGNLKWVERDGFSLVRTFNINDLPNSGTGPTPGMANAYDIWSSTIPEVPEEGDIVQKIIPISPVGSSTPLSSTDRSDVNQSNLLLWTGDGGIGVLGFGNRRPLNGDEDVWHDAAESLAVTAEQKAREDAERQYARTMRRALKRNADEVRFMRGFGGMSMA